MSGAYPRRSGRSAAWHSAPRPSPVESQSPTPQALASPELGALDVFELVGGRPRADDAADRGPHVNGTRRVFGRDRGAPGARRAVDAARRPRAELDRRGRPQREAAAADRHRRAARRRPAFGRHRGHGGARPGALLAFAAFVAPLLLVPVEIAVYDLVVARAVRRRSQWRPVFEFLVEGVALVGLLEPFCVEPRVELGVGDRLVLLVTEPAVDRPVGGFAVGVFAAVATFDARHVRGAG